MNKDVRIVNRDDLLWFEAPLPPREHVCTAWSSQVDALGLPIIQRCACGGVRMRFVHDWIEVCSRPEYFLFPAEKPAVKPKRRRWWKLWGRP